MMKKRQSNLPEICPQPPTNYGPIGAAKLIKNLRKSQNSNPQFRKLMEEKGLTPELLVQKHVELLNAGWKKYDGTVVPDNRIRMQALLEAYKLFQAYPIPEQKVQIQREDTFHVSFEERQLAEQTLRECVDAEIVEANERSSIRPEDESSDARPLY
uniref:Uncharacterized protein n=1 Tax=viral metagenome TaxID=1070528 RepID=A0A6M3IYK3_9ZZZZ